MKYILMLIGVMALVVSGIFLTSDTGETILPTTNTDTPQNTETETGSEINLSGRGLSEVPRSIFDQRKTEVLDLSNNALTGALPAEVRHLQNLRVLNLSDNMFTGVPAEVGQLGDLEVLDLSSNPITGLPYEIGNLKNLRILDLRNTQYAQQDLEVIRNNLPSSTDIRTD